VDCLFAAVLLNNKGMLLDKRTARCQTHRIYKRPWWHTALTSVPHLLVQILLEP